MGQACKPAGRDAGSVEHTMCNFKRVLCTAASSCCAAVRCVSPTEQLQAVRLYEETAALGENADRSTFLQRCPAMPAPYHKAGRVCRRLRASDASTCSQWLPCKLADHCSSTLSVRSKCMPPRGTAPPHANKVQRHRADWLPAPRQVDRTPRALHDHNPSYLHHATSKATAQGQGCQHPRSMPEAIQSCINWPAFRPQGRSRHSNNSCTYAMHVGAASVHAATRTFVIGQRDRATCLPTNLQACEIDSGQAWWS
jgi:hypothetical protein